MAIDLLLRGTENSNLPLFLPKVMMQKQQILMKTVKVGLNSPSTLQIENSCRFKKD